MDSNLFPLPPSHFLSQPRPSGITSPNEGRVDTTTLAAHDFDVDPRTGFMPPHAPIARLEGEYGAWEGVLADACNGGFRLGGGEREERWRGRVRELPILSIAALLESEPHLRRAHHVLAWIMHFYIHTLRVDEEIRIPPPITLPLLQVSREMRLPPVLTYSDDVLYNWAFDDDGDLRILTSFTFTDSESHFYLTSARIELIGVKALGVMQHTLDELFVGDLIARKRITRFLTELAGVIGEMEGELNRMFGGCDVRVFYDEIRPWFQGESEEKRWVFEGIELDPGLEYPNELGGPSAGQSSLIHALDIFLGVHHSNSNSPDDTFLSRMQLYMPRHHRNFLSHLRVQSTNRSLRAWVLEAAAADDTTQSLLNAYNAAVTALKKFRDAHIVLVARYIIGPAAQARANEGQSQSDDSNRESQSDGSRETLKGTGGTHLARFLKSVRDTTQGAVIQM
ncbi:Indoleamine 2,3-dioxygenase [Lentinula novae-zelandiae]|nr:Indoleamine 2,3-dioxygenase [Lentinula novae-zelandiae]